MGPAGTPAVPAPARTRFCVHHPCRQNGWRCVNASTELPCACHTVSMRQSRKPGCMWRLFRSHNPINMICGAADYCRILVYPIDV